MSIDKTQAIKIYRQHQRNINQSTKSEDYFHITFEDWLQLWEESGHYYERGRTSDEYCMARNDMTLPLTKDNAMIITNYEKMKLTHTGRPKSEHTKELMRQKKLGVPKSEEHKRNMSLSATAAHIRRGHTIRKTNDDNKDTTEKV